MISNRWARDRVDRFKGERIVRGMATFIEDCTSIRDDSPGRTRSSSTSQAAPQLKADAMTRMFRRAARILRESTLADGCAIFGATASNGRSPDSRPTPFDGTLDRNAPVRPVPSPVSDSEKHETNSDSDSAPGARPCKVLAFQVRDEEARAEIEDGSMSLGTLEKYFNLFPQGRSFSFTEEGSGISSEDESTSDREQINQLSPSSATEETALASLRARIRKRRMDHKELLKKIPGAKNVIFLPLYDGSEEKFIAGCFLWTSMTGQMITLDADLSYLRAFGNCVVGEVVRMNMQRNESAKTAFIASMSHELRSPLHGILGAAEFLMDTAGDAYQSGLITSIMTCGRTLLDTLNHVLDYSKINKLGQKQLRKHAKQGKPVALASDSNLESLNMTADIDLGTLVEEVAEAVTAGHAFKKAPGPGSADLLARADDAIATAMNVPREEGHVSVLLDISPRRSWMVRIQPGALRRIIMNLLGNSLKYTTSGFVAVSLRAQESAEHSPRLRPRTGNSSNKIRALIRVVDSGKGISEVFQRDRLFIPFSQEDPFQPGTGLGLSIVKQIVDSLGGRVEVRSEQDVGTEFDVYLNLTPSAESAPLDSEMNSTEERIRGQHCVIVGPSYAPNHPIGRLEQTLVEVCTHWFGMRVSNSKDMDQADADIFLFAEPPSLEQLLKQPADAQRTYAVIVVYANAADVASITQNQDQILQQTGRVVELVQQPCGPRKMARVLSYCLKRAEELHRDRKHSTNTADMEIDGDVEMSSPDSEPARKRQSRHSLSDDLGKRMSAAVSYPKPTPLDPSTPSLLPSTPSITSPTSEKPNPISPSPASAPPPSSPQPQTLHILLVDDNKINRNLLVMFMSKCHFTFREAANGQEALDEYIASFSPASQRFDYVLMDISMPVMDGMEATRRIRDFEKENGGSGGSGGKRATIIALTGLASAQAQAEAETVGIDVFLAKPGEFFSFPPSSLFSEFTFSEWWIVSFWVGGCADEIDSEICGAEEAFDCGEVKRKYLRR